MEGALRLFQASFRIFAEDQIFWDKSYGNQALGHAPLVSGLFQQLIEWRVRMADEGTQSFCTANGGDPLLNVWKTAISYLQYLLEALEVSGDRNSRMPRAVMRCTLRCILGVYEQLAAPFW